MKRTAYEIVSGYWLQDFYDCAYETITGEKIPVVVPSYNRYENNMFLNNIRDNMKEEWPIYVVVRESQKKLYEQNYGDLPTVKFVAFKDEDITGIAKTRIKYVEYFSKKFHHIITLDDDARILIKTKAKNLTDTAKMKEKLIEDVSRNDPARLFAMWQLCHEYLTEKYEGCFCTYAYCSAFIFKMDYAEDVSYSIGGKPASAVCLDLKKMQEHKLNYITHDPSTHEDIDIIVRAMAKNLYPISIKCINYMAKLDNNSVFTKQMGFTSVQNRILYQNRILMDIYKDSNPYVHLNKNDNLLINWSRYLKDIDIKDRYGSLKKEVYDNLKKG